MALQATTTPAREGAVTAQIRTNNTILIAGGLDGFGVGSEILSSADIFDPNTQTFTAVANPMVAARANAVAVGLFPATTVLIAGGWNGCLGCKSPAPVAPDIGPCGDVRAGPLDFGPGPARIAPPSSHQLPRWHAA